MPVFHLALEPQLDMAIFTELVRLLPQHVCHVRNWVRHSIYSNTCKTKHSTKVHVHQPPTTNSPARVQEGNTLLFEAVEQGRPLNEVRFVLEQVTHRQGLLDRNRVRVRQSEYTVLLVLCTVYECIQVIQLVQLLTCK